MWQFDGFLLTAPTGKVWPARSGGLVGTDSRNSYDQAGRALPLPRGTYRILKTRNEGASAVSREEMRIPGRRDGWFVPLEPLFHTERGTAARGKFGIHPDGALPGTNGCIGVFSGDYFELWNMLTDRSLSELFEVTI